MFKTRYIPIISSFINFKDTFGILLEFASKRRILIVMFAFILTRAVV